MQYRIILAICALLLALASAAAAAEAQVVPVTSCGYTRTYAQSCAGGTFVPPQTHVEETFYSHPGISLYGPYPGCGYAYQAGVGFTPCGYTPYGAFTYL
jgi:hypothetical protein